MIKRKTVYAVSGVLSCALIALMLTSTDVSASAARDGLYYSARSVIPAIFPFAIVASFLAEVGLPRSFTKVLPLHRLLSLPECAAPALLCGLVGGFPVGAVTACSLYENGRITRGEAALLCAVSSNVSPAFLVCVAGGMFSSAAFGIALWAAQSAVSVAVGMMMRRLTDDRMRKTEADVRERSLAAVLCGSVARSAAACVTVTGYVVFFRVLAAIFTSIFPPCGGVLSLTLEFSSGVEYSAAIGSRAACGFAVGFGGISALAQVWNYASADDIPVYPVLIVKAVSAAVLAVVGMIFC